MRIPVALLGLALAGLALAPPAGADDPEPEIADLDVRLDGGQVVVAFELQNAFSPKLLERVDSGLPTSFEFEIQMLRERRWWFDRKTRRKLEVTATYDAVTMEYQVSYRLKGELVDSRVVQGHADLEKAMTKIEKLPVFEIDSPEDIEDARVRVRADFGWKALLWLIPVPENSDWAVSRDLETEPPS